MRKILEVIACIQPEDLADALREFSLMESPAALARGQPLPQSLESAWPDRNTPGDVGDLSWLWTKLREHSAQTRRAWDDRTAGRSTALCPPSAPITSWQPGHRSGST